MNEVHPYVGFGGVSFSVVAQDNVIADWEMRPVFAGRKVAGSNTYKRQFMKHEPDRLTAHLLIPSAEAFVALRNMIGTTATLTMTPQSIIDAPVANQEYILGTDYIHFANVTLVSIEDARRLLDGRAMCSATFERDHQEAP